jgi:F420-0:gamma-glutamyl ligase
MGEGDETMPLAIIRNSDAKITDRKINPKEMAISHDECLYVRGLKN